MLNSGSINAARPGSPLEHHPPTTSDLKNAARPSPPQFAPQTNEQILDSTPHVLFDVLDVQTDIKRQPPPLRSGETRM